MNRIWGLLAFALYFPIAQAGEIEPYHARTIEPYHAQTMQRHQAQGMQANAPLTPAQAAQREGQVVTVEFTVKSAGWNPAGYDEVYSERSWQDPNAFFIRFPVSMRPQFNNSVAAYFGGQVVRVTGQVQTLNFGSMQRKVIYVTSANQIEKVAAGSQPAAVGSRQAAARAPQAAPVPPPPPPPAPVAPPAPPKPCAGRIIAPEEAVDCGYGEVTTVEFTVEGVGPDYEPNEIYSKKTKYEMHTFTLSFAPAAMAKYHTMGIDPRKHFLGRKLRVVGTPWNDNGNGRIDVFRLDQVAVVTTGNEQPSVAAYTKFKKALDAGEITADGKPVKKPTPAEIASARKVQNTANQATKKIFDVYNQGLGQGVDSDTIHANGNMNTVIQKSYSH